MAITYEEAASITGTRTRPIYWWAAIGFGFVLLDIYVLGAWVLSDKFTPTPIGDTPVPGWVLMWTRLWEAVSVALGVGCVVYIIRSYIRNNRMPALAVFLLAWQAAVWQDPIINFVRPMFTYSSVFFNMGSWSDFIPGWISPNGSKMPEPLFFQAGMYMVGIAMSAVLCSYVMRQAKRRWPTIGVVQLVLIACATGIAWDMFVEFFWVRMQLYSYLGTIEEGTLFYGNIWQFPLYNFCVWGSVLGITGSLYYFRDDKGNMLVERGAEKIRGKASNAWLRVLAVTGFINLIMLAYSVILMFTTLYIDPWPKNTPSWMRNEMCGAGTQFECPAKDVPIPLPDSGPMPPFKGRL